MASHIIGAPASPNRSNLMRVGAGASALDDQFGYRHSFSNSFGSRPGLSLWFGQGDQQAMSMNTMDAGRSSANLYSHSQKPILGSSEFDESHSQKPLSSLMPLASSNYPAIFSSTQNQADGAYAWTNENGPTGASRSLSLSTSAGLTTSSPSANNSNVNDSSGGANFAMNSSYTSQSAQMSATALLQKAAQMGATVSNSAFRGFNIPVSGSGSVGLNLSWQSNNNSSQEQRTHFMKGQSLDQMVVSEQGVPGFHLNRSENTGGLHDLMGSLPGNNGLMGTVNAMQQNPFLEDSASFMIHGRSNAGSNANPVKDQAGFQQRLPSNSSSPSMSSSSSLSQHHHNMMSMQSNHAVALMSGMPNPARNSEEVGAAAGAEGLTRDFLGVGGVQAMQARVFPRNNEHLPSSFSGIDITGSFNNRADDIKSWEAAT
eukprot:TRINITY_DN336_c0_g2_i2.p1 TRINITY_DN336_c0_g2~~TRINITY_DN336_c0_g2_i2.p1  ORF type:complete len:429 (+),score=14.35 TRINITY_DN336_c0_g2_i2:230-1516(+)